MPKRKNHSAKSPKTPVLKKAKSSVAQPSAATENLALPPSRNILIFSSMAGFTASILVSLLWTLLSILTGMKLSFTAFAAALIIGIIVGYIANSKHRFFGMISVSLTVFSALFTNYLTYIQFIAEQTKSGYFEVLTQISTLQVLGIVITKTTSMDGIFYFLSLVLAWQLGRTPFKSPMD